MVFQRGIQGQDVDYLEVLAAWDDAIEKGMKAKKLPTANPYLLVVRKAYSDRIYPHFRKRRSYTITENDKLTYEEMKAVQQSSTNS